MLAPIVGLHHVTAIASDPQRNLDFYTELLGLRLVKQTVNFDDPGTYHLYFGDDVGAPGSILTFFPWPHAAKGRVGAGETSATAFLVPASSLEYWSKRMLAAGLSVENLGQRFGDPVLGFNDPDGMRLELIGKDATLVAPPSRLATVPAEHAIRGFHGVTLCEAGFELTARVLETMGFQRSGKENNRIRFVSEPQALGSRIDILVQPHLIYGNMGAGSVHHIAFRMPSDQAQLDWREVLSKVPLNVTPVLDRVYFHSVYFREPGGVLFELATDPPGFALDEPIEHLGESFKLPSWLEMHRSQITAMLPPLTLPHAIKSASND